MRVTKRHPASENQVVVGVSVGGLPSRWWGCQHLEKGSYHIPLAWGKDPNSKF